MWCFGTRRLLGSAINLCVLCQEWVDKEGKARRGCVMYKVKYDDGEIEVLNMAVEKVNGVKLKRELKLAQKDRPQQRRGAQQQENDPKEQPRKRTKMEKTAGSVDGSQVSGSSDRTDSNGVDRADAHGKRTDHGHDGDSSNNADGEIDDNRPPESKRPKLKMHHKKKKKKQKKKTATENEPREDSTPQEEVKSEEGEVQKHDTHKKQPFSVQYGGLLSAIGHVDMGGTATTQATDDTTRAVNTHVAPVAPAPVAEQPVDNSTALSSPSDVSQDPRRAQVAAKKAAAEAAARKARELSELVDQTSAELQKLKKRTSEGTARITSQINARVKPKRPPASRQVLPAPPRLNSIAALPSLPPSAAHEISFSSAAVSDADQGKDGTLAGDGQGRSGRHSYRNKVHQRTSRIVLDEAPSDEGEQDGPEIAGTLPPHPSKVSTGGVRILSNHYDVAKQIQVGKGTYGDVFKSVCLESGERVAVKRLKQRNRSEGVGQQVGKR